MSKKVKRTMENAAMNNEVNNEEIKSVEGAEMALEQSVKDQIEAQEEGEFREALREEEQERETAPVVQITMGIGQFCRHLLLNNQKLTNTEVLERVLKVFPDAKTTMACIAWYKTDLRKKGQLPQGGGNRSGGKHIELSAEQLAELCK